MSFEKIERAYELLLENVQLIENVLKTTIYDAIIEQNSYYQGAEMDSEMETERLSANCQQLRALQLTKEEWRRAYQFLFIKAAQTESLQPNHQFTPDSIGFLILFMMETLLPAKRLDVLEIGSGTGNLAQTLLNHSRNPIDYIGMEVDDLLIDLSASIAEVVGADVHFIQEDAVRPRLLKESDVVISDLPIGYYPNDTIAKRHMVAASDEHTYAHHLLMEQSLKYLTPDGIAIFLAPEDLLLSPQAHLLKKWLTQKATIVAVVGLPDNLFGNSRVKKSLFILKKQTDHPSETFVYPIRDLQNPDVIQDFTGNFKKWVKENIHSSKNLL